MKIAILSCFYPYRGGISQFNAAIYRELNLKHEVAAFNFTRQYPSFLFPGKTQYVDEKDSADKIESLRILDSANPFSYVKTARKIREWKPDLLLMRYWNSYFAPSLGWIGRHMSPDCKVISIADNIIPHEPHFYDKSFTKYFINSNDGILLLSDAVKDDLLKIKKEVKCTVSPHPLYSHFGTKMTREEACNKLNISPDKKNILFFGLIRSYKGLDILLDAFSSLDSSYQLIIAGEPYGTFDSYQKQIDGSPLRDNIKLFTNYIEDSEVPAFFSASDVCVLPYKSATQSGISAIAYHFDLPMICTDVGGLKESIEGKGTGLITDAITPESVKYSILKFFSPDTDRELFIKNIISEKQRLSWSNFCTNLIEFHNTL